MKVEIQPPYEFNHEAWEKLKRAFFHWLVVLAGLLALATGLAYLLDALIRLFGGYEGSL